MAAKMSSNKKTTEEDNQSSGDNLNLYSTLTLDTQNGQRHIQLLFGDITCLPVKDKVDVIMVSAFAGDYTTTHTSLIGALWYNLNISVRGLSKEKDEDLRQHFHCWWSKPLPDHLPYRRLLCFETPMLRSFKHPAELVGDVFRSLVPMFKEEEKTVITPLLATGDQNHSRPRMLRSMLEAAINWIRAGLPLKCLKIVLYTRRANKLDEEEREIVELFNSIKEKVMTLQPVPDKEPVILYDVYLSFHKNDIEIVHMIQQWILELMTDLKICSKNHTLHAAEAWQEDMYQTLCRCRRILPFLSPNYLQSPLCVEQYNIALCCNRTTKRNLLAPFYIETIDNMPTYMALVQYVDCRLKEGTREKGKQSIKAFVSMMQLETRMSLLKPLTQVYDVFISYSHANSETAMALLHCLQKNNPDLKIFYDRNELKTGSSWQETLYNSLDNSAIVLALLSPKYTQSSVCQEEYNIALSKYLSKEGEIELIPLLIEQMPSISRDFIEVPIIDGTGNLDYVINRVAKSLNHYKKHNIKDNVFNRWGKVDRDISLVLASHRKHQFYRYFQIQKGAIKHKHIHRNYSTVSTVYMDEELLQKTTEILAANKELESKQSEKEEEKLNNNTIDQDGNNLEEDGIQDESKKDQQQQPEDLTKVYDVALICADYEYGFFLDHLLKTRCPSITTNFDLRSDAAQLACLDTAKLIVPLLSPNLVQSGKDVEELHIALARYRNNTNGTTLLYPIQIEELPRWPTYFHLVPCDVALYDVLWKEVLSPDMEAGIQVLPADCLTSSTELISKTSQTLSHPAMLALSCACDSILHLLDRGAGGGGGNATDLSSQNDSSSSTNRLIYNVGRLEYNVLNLGHTHKPVDIKKFLRGVDGQVSTRATKRYISANGSPRKSTGATDKIKEEQQELNSSGDLRNEKLSATCNIL